MVLKKWKTSEREKKKSGRCVPVTKAKLVVLQMRTIRNTYNNKHCNTEA